MLRCLAAPTFASFLAFAPAQEQPQAAVERIAFGSCAREDRPQPIWDAINGDAPDLWLWLGDNIYADTEDVAVFREKYQQLAEQPGYAELLSDTPVLATWDDHDYGVNDGGRDYPLRQEAQRLFLDFFDVPADSPRRWREGIYHAETMGPEGRRLQVIMLDTRYHRSEPLREDRRYVPNDDPEATILGEEQWQWLEQQLREPADLRLVGTSIQFVSEEHRFEKWANFPLERQRMIELIEETGAGGVVFISGDRHLADLSVLTEDAPYPLFDLTSSGLTNGSRNWRAPEANRHRVAGMPWGNNYGVIDVDWEGGLLSLQIRDEQGNVTVRHDVPMERLQPSRAASRPD